MSAIAETRTDVANAIHLTKKRLKIRLFSAPNTPFKIHEITQDAIKNVYEWDEDYWLALFQKQFIVQAALCELYFDVLSDTDEENTTTTTTLYFTPISVELKCTKNTPTHQQALAHTEEHYLPNYSFYLNTENFYQATSSSVHDLLQQFWKDYSSIHATISFADQRAQALALFNLSADADSKTIKQRYRVLASQHHPDKGGDHQHFINIREAFEVLRKTV